MSIMRTGRTLAFAPPSAFARELNRRVKQAMKEEGETRYGNWSQWLRAGVSLTIGGAAYFALLRPSGGEETQIAALVIAALSALMLIIQLGHDASHGSVSPKDWVNRLTLFLVFSVVGVDSTMWRDRHIRLHHQVVNLPGTGIDADSVKLMRLAPDKSWHWWHRLQPLYGPLLLAIGHLHLVWIEDPQCYLSGDAAPRTLKGDLLFAAHKAIHVLLFFAIPALVLHAGLLELSLGYLLASGLIAGFFVLLVVGTHVSDLAAFPMPSENGDVGHDWATHQIVTSVDWMPTSHIAALCTGGANAHAAHHLFPGLNHRHSALVSAIIERTAAEYGIPYCVTSPGGLVAGIWRHMLALSRRPEESASRA
jgi:linoleoyl-CoA desaturase